MAHDVVIAGGGFAGANAARELERILPRQSARLILVNDVNFLLYTPLLPEAAAGTLEPRHVVTPLRDLLRRTYLRMGAVSGHDPAARTVTLTTHDGEVEELRYDQLLVAFGSVSRSLPVPGLDRHAIGFKSLADAIWLRNHIVETLEEANATEDPARRDALLSYVFVGGGYAGLEALAELQDFAADAIQRYPRARLHGMRWTLVEATSRVLPEIDAGLAEYACGELRGRGMDIRLDTTLDRVEIDRVELSTGEAIPARTVVWTAGVIAHPSLRSMRLPLDERGRVTVDDHLAVTGLDGVFAAGDGAAVPSPDGGLCPPTAQHAIRQARVAARNMAANLGVGRPRAFAYRSRGSFVNLGRWKAVASVPGGVTLSGFPAWWAARTYHVSQIPGPARRLRAVVDWTVGLPFRRDTAEVGSIGHPRPLGDELYERGGSHRPLG
ncbi:MAG: NAD(P)/FAD-dependent oxidoreductase [Acidobacteria bacterium]|nr:MAG: NAD(P)/FAD-dependent oxidoreductase [Acidobacteriota bacterium]MCL4286811.1 FAD-dependent oxidoreductase [Thermoleophilia bacterium]GIK78173.1 MAG: NADH dehydrogenase [Actinomycetes bacterium]